ALRQSSRERRSPVTTSTVLLRVNRARTWRKRSTSLEGRTKQRILVKPHFRRHSTNFGPMKPLGPVTRRFSSGAAIYLEFIACADNAASDTPFENSPSRFG